MSDRSGSEESEDEQQPQQQQQQPEFHYESPAERRRREAAEARQRLAEEERQKQEERERKKAEVRKRLEEATKARSRKKGFMTPERKKKLKNLLKKTAAEALKREQERKAIFRKKCIAERCGQPKPLDNANEATLQAICKEYYRRIVALEDAKYDLEYEVRQKDFVINELNVQVNDLRGKFVKPSLKRVSKYEAKFEKLKMMAKSSELDFRAQLKATKKKNLLDEEKKKPEWALSKAKSVGEE